MKRFMLILLSTSFLCAMDSDPSMQTKKKKTKKKIEAHHANHTLLDQYKKLCEIQSEMISELKQEVALVERMRLLELRKLLHKQEQHQKELEEHADRLTHLYGLVEKQKAELSKLKNTFQPSKQCSDSGSQEDASTLVLYP